MAKSSTTFKKGDKSAKEAGAIGKRVPLDVEWREQLMAVKHGTKDDTLLKDIFKILMRNAEGDNMKAIEILMDRTFGTKTTVELTGGLETKQTIINIAPLRSKTKR